MNLHNMASNSLEFDIKELTSDQFLKSIKIIHMAFLSGTVLLLIVMTNMIGFGNINFQNIDYTILGFAGIGLISFIFIGKLIIDKKNASIVNTDKLMSKLITYRTNKIVQMALTEAPIMICIVLAFIFKEYALLVVAFLAIIYLFSIKPSKDEIIVKIPLSSSEKNYLNGHMKFGVWESNNEMA